MIPSTCIIKRRTWWGNWKGCSIACAVDAGLSCTIMPKAITEHIESESRDGLSRAISAPIINANLSLCVSERTPLS